MRDSETISDGGSGMCNATFVGETGSPWNGYKFTCTPTGCTYTFNNVVGTNKIYAYKADPDPSTAQLLMSVPQEDIGSGFPFFYLIVNCTTASVCLVPEVGALYTLNASNILPELINDDSSRYWIVSPGSCFNG